MDGTRAALATRTAPKASGHPTALGPTAQHDGEDEASEHQGPQCPRGAQDVEQNEANQQAPSRAAGDVGRLQHSHASTSARDVVVNGPLEYRKGEPHQDGGHAEEGDGKDDVEQDEALAVVHGAELEAKGAPPVPEVPNESRRLVRDPAEKRHGTRRPGE